ncbi:MAG: hypothetical protein HGB15_09280 [Chlorobaculum sp.]|nr:hypothetical protein [Chlorobaculum sp.]
MQRKATGEPYFTASFRSYNRERYHPRIGSVTPEQEYPGKCGAVLAARKRGLAGRHELCKLYW